MIAQPPQPPPVAPAAQVAGKLKLTVQRTHGASPYAVVGERIVISGGLRPYVAGQKVLVSIYRDGRRVLSRRLAVGAAAGGGTGRFRLSYASPRGGLLSVRAEHTATPQMSAFAARPVDVRYFRADLSVGARGPAVWALQDGLAAARYEVPVSGYFDEATARAVIAYRKMTGLARIGSVDARIFDLLQRGAGRFRARYPGEGNHVEADLSRQVLVELEAHGRVRRIYTMSSGKPSTPSVIGRFRVYEKTPGTNSEGMVDSNYFIRGYAIHGYAEVPVYAASHGCLRIPIPDAPAVYAWVKVGYPVDVYTDNGRGSHLVRANAGP